ncbi:MAG TPA: glycosyltransferase [Acidimicrobiales bacterium]|nr:glycosyltransferase [Acidimicrobiales bacterium]
MSRGRPRPDGPALSVVLSTLGNYETLEKVLDGYSKQSADPESFEVVVATDAADPHPEAVDTAIGARRFETRRITGPVPGLSANRNAGIEAARASLILLTDNDTIPVRRLVSEHLAWHRRHQQPNVGVQGRVRWSRELEVSIFMRWLDTGIQFDFANIRGTEAGWGRFAGANVSFKKDFAQRVGDFDQQHFPYGYEDTDWAYRASKLGFRLLYNRRAVVDHLRPMTLEFWQKRARRVAVAEQTFVRLHPEMSPWFYGIFSAASKEPPGRGRGVPLAPYVPRWAPLLGPRVWRSVDRTFTQAIAPYFLSSWEEALALRDATGEDLPAAPDLSEFLSDSPGGSPPGGPK